MLKFSLSYSFQFLQYFCIHSIVVIANYKDRPSLPNGQNEHPYTGELNSHTSDNLFNLFHHPQSSDESKLRLAILVDEKIDSNKDGSIQLDELVRWLRECQNKYTSLDVARKWAAIVVSNDIDAKLSWKDYLKHEYENVAGISKFASDNDRYSQIKSSHEQQIERDLRRWRAADYNQDGALTRSEFESFLYPEHFELMRPVLMEESFEKLDKNKDSRVSIDEYLIDAERDESHKELADSKGWLEKKREKVKTQLDLNNDGYLSKDELASWLSESEYHDHSIAEAQNLMLTTDLNKDHRLSKEEVLLGYNEFLNSHATDFGEYLKDNEVTRHDEL